jgi:hypothetical protein
METISLDDLGKKIKNSLARLVTLEIVTVIGEIEKVPESEVAESKWRAKANSAEKGILTKMDLLQGDITTIIPKSFFSDDKKAMREYHSEREKQGLDIVKQNIAAVKELWNLIAAIKEE